MRDWESTGSTRNTCPRGKVLPTPPLMFFVRGSRSHASSDHTHTDGHTQQSVWWGGEEKTVDEGRNTGVGGEAIPAEGPPPQEDCRKVPSQAGDMRATNTSEQRLPQRREILGDMVR